MKTKIIALESLIAGWYENAKIDYGTTGHVIRMEYFENLDTLLVSYFEDGKVYNTRLPYASEYTANELYNIWMEGE